MKSNSLRKVKGAELVAEIRRLRENNKTLEEIIQVQDDIIALQEKGGAREEAMRHKETRRKEKWTRRALRYQVMAYISIGINFAVCFIAIMIIAALSYA